MLLLHNLLLMVLLLTSSVHVGRTQPTRPYSLPRPPANREQPSLIPYGPRKQFSCLCDTP